MSAISGTVARAAADAYVGAMSETPAFLDGDRPPVPDIVVPRGVTPFFLPRRPVRGRLVRLGPLADALLTRHPNHPAVTRLAGQSLALAAALSTALKFRGSFSVQAKGDGPVPMLLADCTDTGALRGYARAEPEKLEALLRPDPVAGGRSAAGRRLPRLHRRPGARTRTATRASSPSRAATSPRWRCTISAPASSLRCFVHLACEQTEDGWRAGALILEKIAGAGGIDPTLDAEAQEESWRTATILAGHADRRASCWTMSCRRNGCCTGCSTARAWRPTGRARCPTAAAARAPGWSASWKASRPTIWITWQWTATSS